MNPAANYAINLERVKHDIYSLGRFGYNEQDQGIYRQGFSVEDMKARHQLMEHMCNHGIRRRERPGYTGKKCSGDQRQ